MSRVSLRSIRATTLYSGYDTYTQRRSQMILKSLTPVQRAVVGLMLFVASALCIFVPFEAELNGTRSKIGYALIWSPPSRISSCESAFMPKDRFGKAATFDLGDYAWQLTLQSKCDVQPSFTQIGLTIAGTTLFAAVLLLLAGVTTKKPVA